MTERPIHTSSHDDAASSASAIDRVSGLAAVGAGVMMVLAAVLAGATAVGEPGASQVRFVAANLALLVSYGLLLVALVGLWRIQRDPAGWIADLGMVLAGVGVLLQLGATWANAFVSPWLVDLAPEAAGVEATGTLRMGLFISAQVFALGWSIFALSTIRAKVFNRFAAVLLLLFSVLSFFPTWVDPTNTVKLPTELHQPIPLAIIIAVLGVLTLRRRRALL